MAQIKTTDNDLDILSIDNFYGLNLQGETQIKIGESPNMTNCYIMDTYDLSKMYGYKQVMTTISETKNIQGMWYGELNSSFQFLFACNGHIYKITNSYWQDETLWNDEAFSTHTTDLGTLTDAETRFFTFDNKVYIINGYEYKYWDGVLASIADVDGYIPKTYISCTPDGSSQTAYELNNFLTGKKHYTANGDGTSTVYQLPETSITSVDYVYVDNVLQTLTSDYTVNTTNGTVTFVSAPTEAFDNVDIYWTKGSGSRSEVYNNRAFCLFGSGTDSRVFLYGNQSSQNSILYSELANGVPSAEYFTSANLLNIGDSNSAVYDIVRQYSNILIAKDNGESYYATYESMTIDDVDYASFPTYPLNDGYGSQAFGQGRVLNNYPVTIDNGIIKWKSTSVRDERNVEDISSRIKADLDNLNLSSAITYDFQDKYEYWLAIGTKLYIYNYNLDTFSRIELANTPTCFIVINGEMWMGTATGLIMKFSEDFLTFNGSTIECHWESGFLDFEYSWYRKTLNKLWVSIKPQTKVSAVVNYISDREEGQSPITIDYDIALLELGETDFSDWSFKVNFNPQPILCKLRAKKFSYIKVILDNDTSTDTMVILKISLKSQTTGYVK